jgi:PAS domain S-box-containing protein
VTAPPRPHVLEETAEELFEDAPCGYLTTDVDGLILRVNRTFEAWTGHRRERVVGQRRFQDLLSAGGRIYHETHYRPLLHMQGAVREIAVEIERADGSRLPALVNSVLRSDDAGRPRTVRTTVFDATDRRRYEQELLRARRHEQQIGVQLQRSLLSGSVPRLAGLELGLVYRPGVAGLEVGGDWYDAFELDGGGVGLVVGDVVGRGIDAAATMGQLRSAVRALASTGLRPGALLDALDAYARRHRVGRMATVVYGQLDVGSGELRFACAGHPPPLVLGADGSPRLAWGGRSLPLDVLSRPGQKRTEASVALEAGGALVLYTDGLVERRGRSLDDGLDALQAEAAKLRGCAATELAEQLVERLPAGQHPDDLCVLTARRPVASAAAPDRSDDVDE